MPLRCRQCFLCGHTINFCNNNKIGFNCGEEEHLNDDDECTRTTKCANCSKENRSENNYSVLNKKCPVFLKFKELQTIKTIDKCDNKTALEKYKQRHPNETFAQTTRNLVKYDDQQHNKTNKTSLKKDENKVTTSSANSKKSTNVTILPKNTSKRMRNEIKNKISPIKNNKKLCTNNAESEIDSDI